MLKTIQLGGREMFALLTNPGLRGVEIRLLSLPDHNIPGLSVNTHESTWEYRGMTQKVGEPLGRTARREIVVGVYDLSSESQLNSMVYRASRLINEPI
jgi:hypothetical protein